MNVLQKEPSRLVVLENGGNVVRKIYFDGEPNQLYDLAAREFEHMRLFRHALTGLGGATCPKPLEIHGGTTPFIRMERAAGMPMEDYLYKTVWFPELYQYVARTIRKALEGYIDTFNEAYWDFIIRNMFFDPSRGLITFLDFGIPESHVGILDQLARYPALEFSLGTLAASPVFESKRPGRMLRRREHRQAYTLAAAVIRSFRDSDEPIDLRTDDIRDAARIAYRLAVDSGSRARRDWYKASALLATTPDARINRLCDFSNELFPARSANPSIVPTGGIRSTTDSSGDVDRCGPARPLTPAMMPSGDGGPTPPPHDSLLITDLLDTLGAGVGHLITSLRLADPLDSFLFAAQAVQIVEDYLQRDSGSLRRAARYLGPSRFSETLTGVAAALEHTRRRTRGARHAAHWCERIRTLRDQLADAVITGAPISGAAAAAEDLQAEMSRLPSRLVNAFPVLPACFRSFDVQPADLQRLANDFAKTVRATRPVMVVGVRTSGSYMAPLVGARLADLGFPTKVITIRPGRPLAADDREHLAAMLARGASIAVVDDPPDSGGSVRQTVDLLVRNGAPVDDVTLLLPVFGDSVPPGLARFRSIVRPFNDWAVHEMLDTERVRSTLSAMWNRPIREVVPTDDPRRRAPSRSHVSGTFRICDDARRVSEVTVIGAGLGYLGRHSIAIATALPEHLPKTFGFRDGLVFREWLPRSAKVRTPDPVDAAAFARYVADRAARLPAEADHSRSLRGRQPVWEVASQLISLGYGPLRLPLLLPVLDPAIRSLCTVSKPSIVDGGSGLCRWFRVRDSLRVVDADRRAFSNAERSCYDSIFDIAGIAPGCPDADFTAALRRAYPCPDERFLIYQLVHLQDRVTRASVDPAASARAVRRYVAGQLPMKPTSVGGGLCAIDIDGVLECDLTGFTVITPTAVLALRALSAHGYRPVPVTGRSLDEVRDRCLDLGLAGGVAEYGSVAYRATDEEVIELVDNADRVHLDRLRDRLRATPGVHVEADYRRIVRVTRAGPKGGSVPPSVISAALDAVGASDRRLQVINGERQTDIVAPGIDKAVGLAALCRLLGNVPVDLAVGDTAADVPMFALATRAYGPGNSTPEVRRSIATVLRPRYAAGLSAAARLVLGHSPGHCTTCAPPSPSADARLMLSILDSQRAGRRGAPLAAVRTAVALLSVQRRPKPSRNAADRRVTS